MLVCSEYFVKKYIYIIGKIIKVINCDENMRCFNQFYGECVNVKVVFLVLFKKAN